MEAEEEHNSKPAASGQLQEMPGSWSHFALATSMLYGMNSGLGKMTHEAGIEFPSALIGKTNQSIITFLL